MNRPFIFLGNGKVHFVNASGAVFPLESVYAADLMTKALKAQERHAWKGESSSRNLLSGPSLWGKNEPQPLAITFTSLEPVINFFAKLSVQCKHIRALRLGWETNERVIRVM